ncbi:phosphoglucosamine mutase [Mycoplasma sp. P36-A1]|uniref:phosphoglucosamine mutase n=1 Tax=Mycoplasma sp. P36-A1 TaxID=3252900 RepID=UPI003C2C35AC
MGKYFGTDGVRGVANEKLTAAMAFKIGEYLGHVYQGNKVIIGSDTRISKDMLRASLCAGLTSQGVDVCNVGVVSTPCVSYLTKNDKFKAGIMISASHNPYYDNGIKIFNEKGEKISAELENEIEDFIDNKIDLKHTSRDHIGRIIEYNDHVNYYLDNIISTVEEDLSSFKIAVDCANGSASQIVSKVLSDLNINAYIIDNKPDGYNINVDSGSTHLNNIANFVKKNEGFDLGLAFDGDADRVLAVDEEGNEVDGDQIMYICARYLKEKDKLVNNTIVTTVMSNIGLYKALDKHNIAYDVVSVGDKYVYESLKKNKLSLGGEQSGHIIFNEYANTGDGMLSGIQLLNALKYFNKSLNMMLKELTVYPQLLKNVRVVDKDKVLNNELLLTKVTEVENTLKDNGRVLLRASGTEPLIRVMVEAASDEEAKKYVDVLVDIIEGIE